jgi:hypothetical protein
MGMAAVLAALAVCVSAQMLEGIKVDSGQKFGEGAAAQNVGGPAVGGGIKFSPGSSLSPAAASPKADQKAVPAPHESASEAATNKIMGVGAGISAGLLVAGIAGGVLLGGLGGVALGLLGLGLAIGCLYITVIGCIASAD